MLKQTIRENLETVVQYTLQHHGGDETLAFDVSKQCVTEDDVERVLEVMFEHISEKELNLMIELVESDFYNRYTQAMSEGMRAIDPKIKNTLQLMGEPEGEC